MKRPLRPLVGIRMTEYLRRCAGYRIEWRRLFLMGAIMTAAGVVLQMFTLPYPLNVWFLSMPVTVTTTTTTTTTSGESNSTMKLRERVIESRVEHSRIVSAAPSVLLNSRTELSETVIEPDTSSPLEPQIKAPTRQTRKSVSRRRKKNIKVKKVLPPPPPPPPRRIIPYRLQVKLLPLFPFHFFFGASLDV